MSCSYLLWYAQFWYWGWATCLADRETLVIDNGPQVSGQPFQDFVKAYGFRHITTSLYFPQSNGEAVQNRRAHSQAGRSFSSSPRIQSYIYPSDRMQPCTVDARTLVENTGSCPGKETAAWVAWFLKGESNKSNYKLYYDRRHGSCLLTVRQTVRKAGTRLPPLFINILFRDLT